MFHFSTPHSGDVIEIRAAKGQPAIGCIRIQGGQHRLFRVAGDGLELVGLFASLGQAKNLAGALLGEYGKIVKPGAALRGGKGRLSSK